MNRTENSSYPYMGPPHQVPPQRYQQMIRPYPPQQVMECYPPGYQNMEPKVQDSHEMVPNLKYEYTSPPHYPSPMPEQKDSTKNFVSRIPKVTTEQIEEILSQNFGLLKDLNDCNSIDDPNYLSNFWKLHQNLMFLARISDQPN